MGEGGRGGGRDGASEGGVDGGKEDIGGEGGRERMEEGSFEFEEINLEERGEIGKGKVSGNSGKGGNVEMNVMGVGGKERKGKGRDEREESEGHELLASGEIEKGTKSLLSSGSARSDSSIGSMTGKGRRERREKRREKRRENEGEKGLERDGEREICCLMGGCELGYEHRKGLQNGSIWCVFVLFLVVIIAFR